MWEGAGDRTELQYIAPPQSYGHQRCAFLVLQGCSTGGPGAHSSECWLSPSHLVTKGSDLQTNWLPVFTELYNGSIAYSIYPHNLPSGCVTSAVLGMACLIVIERKNCHAVHRSLSSGASVNDYTPGFYLVPYCQSDLPTPIEYALPPSLEWHVWRVRRSIYNSLFEP